MKVMNQKVNKKNIELKTNKGSSSSELSTEEDAADEESVSFQVRGRRKRPSRNQLEKSDSDENESPNETIVSTNVNENDTNDINNNANAQMNSNIDINMDNNNNNNDNNNINQSSLPPIGSLAAVENQLRNFGSNSESNNKINKKKATNKNDKINNIN